MPDGTVTKPEPKDLELINHAYCRHGDIKPENILFFDVGSNDARSTEALSGLLVISDYGSMKRYRTATVLRSSSFSCTGTLDYASPESMSRSERSSRADDIWSLGCVFMEFAIWMVHGWRGLCDFTASRGGTFYTLISGESQSGIREYVLNEHVGLTLQRLHQSSKCSLFLHDLLELVREMLETQSVKRIKIKDVHSKLCSMLESATAESQYLTIPVLASILHH
jgi:serine/threonine protein kinase